MLTSDFDNLLAQAGLMGITVVASSGDNGVSPTTGSRGTSCGYVPSWPSVSQYVLSVGATMGPEKGNPEQSCQSDCSFFSNKCDKITSGGGFSMYRPVPSYQASYVSAYFKAVKTQAKDGYVQFKTGNNAPTVGRGYPDISALGAGLSTVLGGKWYPFSGTSASAPIIAGIIALINSQRMQRGKSPVGWINPALYAAPATAFNDIVAGNNKCRMCDSACEQSGGFPTCCTQGFYAATGWDPMTGRGSPNYPNMLSYFLSLQ